MELAEELAVICVAVKEASEKRAFLGMSGSALAPKQIFSPEQGSARQITQAVNQRVSQGQTAQRQMVNDKEQQAKTVDPLSSKKIAPIQPASIGLPSLRKGYTPPSVGGIGAPIPIKAAAVENPVDFTKTRAKFEALTARERLLRQHSKEWEELAETRSEREDPSSLNTVMQRLLPIPHTMGEAAIRAPLAGLAGYGGYRLAANTEPTSIDELQRVLGSSRGSNERLRPIERNLADLVGKPRAARLTSKLRRADPNVASWALREMDILPVGEDVQKLRKQMDKILGKNVKGKILRGPQGRARIKSEIKNLFRQTQKEGFIPRLNFRRLGGAASGLALGGLLSGVPFVLNALYRKGEGGEAAHRARQTARDISEEANRLATEREALL